MKNFISLLLMFSFITITPYLHAKDYGSYGLVVDGSGSVDTLNERIYEYGDGNDNNYYYCFHASLATAANIRLGKKDVSLENVHNTFVNYFSAYRNDSNAGGKRSANLGMFRMLGDTEKFSRCPIPDLNVVLRQINKGDSTALFNKIKDGVNYDYPIVVALKKYNPEINNSSWAPTATGFSGNVGHALVIVGYVERADVEDSLVLIRDVYLEEPVDNSWSQLFDYMMSVEDLMDNLQASNNKYDLILFKTKQNGDLKELALQDANAETYSDYLSDNERSFQPDGSYFYSNKAGYHSSTLTGPQNADFDLYLYKWNSGWEIVRSSTSGSSNESIEYNGSSGYYIWMVKSYSGSGNFKVTISKP